MASFGTPQLNANNQSNEHFRANFIAYSTRTNHIRYAVLLLFGIEKAKYGREITQATVAIQLKKARLYRAFFIVQYLLLSKKNLVLFLF